MHFGHNFTLPTECNVLPFKKTKGNFNRTASFKKRRTKRPSLQVICQLPDKSNALKRNTSFPCFLNTFTTKTGCEEYKYSYSIFMFTFRYPNKKQKKKKVKMQPGFKVHSLNTSSACYTLECCYR